MYKQNKMEKTTIDVNNSYIGETLENKVRRILNNNEPITDHAPLIYTERKNGVQPEYDIRTDRWEVAIDAMDKVTKTHQAKREDRQKEREKSNENDKKPPSGGGGNETKGQSIQGTE